MRNGEIELLSPARDVPTAKSAILAGADAVYIGASAFGARAAATNNIDDIAELCSFARIYGVKIYLALNTLLHDHEVDEACALAWDAWRAGVDALIVQDMGLLECSLPPLEIHASTQCHIASVDKAKFLEDAGFERIVVARELSCAEISKIRDSINVPIEAFVHGALCVSYSGQCALSYAIGGRSANRGECAQPCRMVYSFKDALGKTIAPDAHYLSLRDMNRARWVGDMIDAGVRSFKIEGRLKDAAYVKNVTLAYRKILDEEIKKRGLVRSSYGEVRANFEPDLSKTFNRGFTNYNIVGERKGNAAFSTPKARGEFIGKVSKTFREGMFFNGNFSNGDGLLFESPDGSVSGAQVSKVDGNKIYLGAPPRWYSPKLGAKVFRNKDMGFAKILAEDCQRKMPVDFTVSNDGNFYIFSAKLCDERQTSAQVAIPISNFEIAKNAEVQKGKIESSFSRLGDFFYARNFNFETEKIPFMGAAQMNSIRRDIEADLRSKLSALIGRDTFSNRKNPQVFDASKYDFERGAFANILNQKARDFYSKRGIDISEFAFESGKDMQGKRAMTTLHCVLRELGLCKRENPPKNFIEPFYLENSSARLRLSFDCKRCGMDIFFEQR